MPRKGEEKKLGETLLINEELLKLYSPISKNVGVDKIFPFLHLAQPFYIEPILGTGLLTELQGQIETDTLTENNKALIIKVAHPLSLWTNYLAMRSLAYSVTEKSITLEHSENSQPISEKELGQFILNIKNMAEMATDLLIKYLCRCQNLYPLWKPESECDCAKYEQKEGSAKNKLHQLIYFPKKGRDINGCYCHDDFFNTD